mgnify:CR=1 FL=1
MLEIKNLCFSAESETGKTEILKNLSLTVPNGKFIVITGPNGGGKSTLAKLIMGIEKPVSGQIFWNGQDITALDVTQRAKLGISYGFQQPPRFKGMKVSDLLSCAAGKNLSMEDGCKYLTQVGLCAREYIDRDVDASLSGGELKRIEIATILAKGGNMMIFDEPEAGIDLWSFSRLTATFEAIHQDSSASMIIISHQERIIRLADEIVLISGGEIQAQGPVDEIFPKILANTTGSCSYLEDA